MRSLIGLLAFAVAGLGCSSSEHCGSGAICRLALGIVELSAGAGAPLAVVATDTGYRVAFGEVAAGENDSNLLLRNTGAVQVQILSVATPTHPQFTLDLAPGTVIQPGVAVTVRISFTPSAPGPRMATVDIETDSQTPSLRLDLSGSGK